MPAAAYIQVREAAPTDPFSLPIRSISQIRAEEASPSSLHRVKVTGVVTYRDGRMLCVQDETGGAQVLGVAPGDIAVGDHVEVAGFPDRGLLRGLRQLAQHRGTHSLVICTSLPQFTCRTQHTGEVAYRNLCPCFPQVVANTTA